MNTQKRTLSRRTEALTVVCLVVCLGALGLHAATQTTTFAPTDATVGNARLLALAVTQYTVDYDETLPPTHTVAEFQTALRLYVPDPAIFVSRVTGQPFIPNPAISGKAFYSFSDPYIVAVFQDTAAKATVGFLDGHIERGGTIQGNPKILSTSYARALSAGVTRYTQDNNEFLPLTNTQAVFQAALLPYVGSQKYFIDPLNGKPFVPNPTLSGILLTSINSPRTTVLLQSAMPYSSGTPTIAYVDGHVTPSPKQSSSGLDFSNLLHVGQAVTRFEQDNNETIPLTNDYTAFETSLQPYLMDTDVFISPASGLHYVLNPAVSGLSLFDPSLSYNTELARDAKLNPNGTLNHLQVDGHVSQDLYFVPSSLAVGPDDQTYLFWRTEYQKAALWALLPGGTAKSTYSLNSPGYTGVADGFSIGSDGRTRLFWYDSYAYSQPFDVPVTGLITLNTIGPDEVLEDAKQFGPYDGWDPSFLTTGVDNNSRLLWQRYDGTLALWTLSPEGDFVCSVTVPTLKGGTPIGLALGADGLTRLLWKTAHGDATLWTVAESGQVVRSFGIPSPPGYTLTALGLGSDGASRFLWGDGEDHAAVLGLTSGGGFVGYVTFARPGGGTASQIGIGKAGDLRVLWEASNGSGQLQTLTAAGKQTSVQSLTPYQ